MDICFDCHAYPPLYETKIEYNGDLLSGGQICLTRDELIQFRDNINKLLESTRKYMRKIEIKEL